MSAQQSAAVLFDVDGTLVDSNYLHVRAWTEAIEAVGRSVPRWKVHRAIGMDSTQLLARLLGSDAESLGAQAKELHARKYDELADQLRPFDCARDLLRAVHERGIAVVLATSAPENELAKLRDALECEDAISYVTSSGDVEQAKPDPEVLQAALQKAGVPASRAVLVGDAVWDGIAAQRVGLPFVGVLSGGLGEGELRGAGACAVYEDACDLLRGIEQSPLLNRPDDEP